MWESKAEEQMPKLPLTIYTNHKICYWGWLHSQPLGTTTAMFCRQLKRCTMFSYSRDRLIRAAIAILRLYWDLNMVKAVGNTLRTYTTMSAARGSGQLPRITMITGDDQQPHAATFVSQATVQSVLSRKGTKPVFYPTEWCAISLSPGEHDQQQSFSTASVIVPPPLTLAVTARHQFDLKVATVRTLSPSRWS